MMIRFWGTRGAIATPGVDTLELGGNTSCVEVALGQLEPILVDCGTGIIEYALAGTERSAAPVYHLLITHFHWDHLLGFPFFFPIHAADATIHLYAPFEVEVLREHVGALFDGTYSPLRDMNNLPATIAIHQLRGQAVEIAGVEVTWCPTDHTDPCFAYRFRRDGVTVCLASDHESRDNATNEALSAFVAGADLLIHGAQFTEEQYRCGCEGLGHSSIERAIAAGGRAGAGRLLLTHHHPLHTDDWLRVFLARVLRQHPSSTPVELAREGGDYELAPRRAHTSSRSKGST